jgi:hypothetical protein
MERSTEAKCIKCHWKAFKGEHARQEEGFGKQQTGISCVFDHVYQVAPNKPKPKEANADCPI